MMEVLEFIKNLWQNKRTRALSILIIYIIFFIIIFTTLNRSKPVDKFDYLKNIEILNYSVTDKYDEIITEYNSTLISGEVIYRLVKNANLESTNYIDNSNTYHITSDDYEKIINNVENETLEPIRITLSDNKIILDFTSYYGYKINIEYKNN
ncbi:MAG: hypothetical protein E7170_00500 [Firmicutes bacterium]|nr:hypothetical protein [Bacillota bacterium]